MFQFELHPHTGEIRTEILVYEKGVVIKHVEAPGINKVERCGIGLNILLSTAVPVVCLSYCWPHGSKYHYDVTVSDHTKCVIPHRHTFGLLSHHVRLRRRVQAEIAAIWCYRPPIKNMSTLQKSVLCQLSLLFSPGSPKRPMNVSKWDWKIILFISNLYWNVFL